MTEMWRDVVGYEGLYKVSNMGNVYSCRQNRLLKPAQPDRNHYAHVDLADKDGKHKTWTVHRLVALTWVPGYEPGLEAEHIDTDRTNNRADNLRWTTHQENCRNIKTREKMAGVGVIQMDMDGNVIARYVSQQMAAELTGIQQSSISQVCNNKRNHAGGYIWRFDIKIKEAA